MRAMTSAEALAIAAGKLKGQSDGRPFRWTPRRDRELVQLREDLFSYADCAKILGGGCTPDQAKARMAELRKDGVAGAPSEVVEGDQHAPSAAGVRAEGDGCPPRPRPEIKDPAACEQVADARSERMIAHDRSVTAHQHGAANTDVGSGGGAAVAVAAPRLRPAKLQLPRHGEMEKRYDPVTRAQIEGAR